MRNISSGPAIKRIRVCARIPQECFMGMHAEVDACDRLYPVQEEGGSQDQVSRGAIREFLL